MEQSDFELSQLQGFLYPLNLPDPPSFCTSSANTGSLKIFLGRNEVYTSLSHYVILQVDGKDRMVIDRDDRGRIALSLDILDEQGRVIVTFEHGRFTVAQSNILDVQRPNRGTIVVRDRFKNEVLNASYLNPASLVVSALLRYPGSNPVKIDKTSRIDGFCLGNVGSVAIAINTKP